LLVGSRDHRQCGLRLHIQQVSLLRCAVAQDTMIGAHDTQATG
jgi:hypothetical protein